MKTLITLLGLLYVMDATFSPITYGVCILSVGICVDYSIHSALAIAEDRGDMEERVYDGILEVGPPVFNGAIATALGVVGLYLGESYPFHLFAHVTLCVVCIGLWYGLVVLPAAAYYIFK